MELSRFNQKELIFSLDIGTRSIIGTVGVVRDKKFQVICEKYLEHEERAMVDGQIHDINLVASVVAKVKASIEEEIGVNLTDVSIAAAGRFLRTVNAKSEVESNEDEEINKEAIRGLELSAVKNAERSIISVTEGKLYCVGYSVKAYYLNGYLISNLMGHKGESMGCEVIATFLPRSVIDSLYSVMNKVGLKVSNLTLEPIAAIEAVVPKKLRLLNIALVDIGAGTSDIAISSKESISAYGMVPIAGDEVTEAIVQEYLVDFNTAESIKRLIGIEENISYIDVLGLENTVASESVYKVIENIVKKLAKEISDKIIELNGSKSPSAVFLVGGGAHTPKLLEEVAECLNLPPQRIAIKDRGAVMECVCDNELGSAGVTVLGIALTAIRSMGNDFIDVILNDEPISLFNSHKHIVMDVLLQAGVNPNLLICKNGKSTRFTYNGKKRIVFGEYGTNAVVTINGEEATLDSEVNHNDKIDVVYAQNGKDAEPKLVDNITNVNSISVFLDDKIVNVEPVILVNGEESSLDVILTNGDDVKVFLPNKVSDFKQYVLKSDEALVIEGHELNDDYELAEGDKVQIKTDKVEVEEIAAAVPQDNGKAEEEVTETEAKTETSEIEVVESEIVEEGKEIKEFKEEFPSIHVKANGEDIVMTGKSYYVIVDIFNYIDFDLTIPKGIINLKLNGKDSAYTEELKDNDVIEVFWS